MTTWNEIPGWPLHLINENAEIICPVKGLLPLMINNAGYQRAHLKEKVGGSQDVLVHRLMAQTFIPNPKNLEHVNHINGVKSDNRIKNLEWISKSENTKHAHRTGLCKNSGGGRKLSIAQAKEIFASDKSTKELAQKYNVSTATIYYIKMRKKYK